MTDNVAVLQGYTKEYFAICGSQEFPILVRPGTDLDTAFRAWCPDDQEFLTIYGWLCGFEEVDDALTA